MYQQEIQFFWPLTEQMQLDLDYSVCIKPNLTTSIGLVSGVTCSLHTGSWATTTSSFTLRENETTMIVMKKPNLLRKFVFKLIGFKWEGK